MPCVQAVLIFHALVCIITCRKAFGIRAKLDGDPELKLEDTNVALIGSDKDKAVKKAAALTEPAWEGAGMKPGIEVWRIMQFKLVKWPEELHGQFYENDAYIVLHTVSVEIAEGSMAAKAYAVSGDVFVRSIHFWLGEGSAIDERGVAAYKTVELDAIFDGGATQHREVMHTESEEFKGLFKGGLKYLKGGTESGFKHVETNVRDFDTKLYQVRRMRSKAILVYEVPLETHSLNQDDCFVLAKGLNIFQFQGRRTHAFERYKAHDVASYIHSQRPYSHILEVEDKEPTDDQLSQDPFWHSLKPTGKVREHNEVSDESSAVEGEYSKEFNAHGVPGKRGVPGPELYMMKDKESVSLANGTAVYELVSSWVSDHSLREAAATYMLLYGSIQAELFVMTGEGYDDYAGTYLLAKKQLYKWGMAMDTPIHFFRFGQMVLNKQFAEF